MHSMKPRHFPLAGAGTLAAASFLLAFAPALCAHAQSAAVNPFTYLGRVMDSEHKAFDADRVATVSAFDAEGEKLVESKTTFLENSRRNYKLVIPLADGETEGYATPGAILSISVDDGKKVWSGVVVDEGRASGTAVGEPGGVREVDIVLGEDADGDGIDDALRDRLEKEWIQWNDDWTPGTAFDPREDHDGDGVPTIDEALAGTDPFDTNSVLRITAFALDDPEAPGRHLLRFPAMPGRAYAVESANCPTGAWSEVSFYVPDAASPVNVLSRPSKGEAGPATVYLLPTSADSAFFRVKLDGDPDPAD